MAKNLFLEPDRTIKRKIQEMMLAVWLERRYTKEQILEFYLNSVFFGENAYGVTAAAEEYFGKSLDQLTINHVASTTDIQPGDLLVTSGLGGRFPIGYPVAVVSEVVRNPGEAFARISATPNAALDRARHALLVFSRPPGQQQAVEVASE